MHGVYVRLLLRPHFRRIDVDTLVYVNCAFRILLILIFFVFFFPSPIPKPSYFTTKLYDSEIRMAYWVVNPTGKETVLLTHGEPTW